MLQISTLWSLNDCLAVINLQISPQIENSIDSDWNVSDGKSLVRFYDGLVRFLTPFQVA